MRVATAERDAGPAEHDLPAPAVSDSSIASPPVRSADPGDDYLLALAEREEAVLVSGDDHLLTMAAELPMHSSASFLTLLAKTSG